MPRPWFVAIILLALPAGLTPGHALAGPALVYSTTLGGTDADNALQMKLEPGGDAFLSGATTSLDFPTTPGAYQPLPAGGGTDLFAARVDLDLGQLVWATYVGGSGPDPDYSSNMAIDAAGAVYLTGDTTSTDFPVQNAFQPAPGGAKDAFVTKLDAAGSLVYSTYLGGIDDDSGSSIAVDAAGSAYVVGDTYSASFPLRTPWQPLLKNRDAFLTKLAPAGNALVYSTFLGGTDQDGAVAVAVDAAGDAFVGGITVSTDFPTRLPLQASPGGFEDSFITAFNPAGSGLLYSTYLGGSGSDRIAAIAAEAGGRAWVVGFTNSAVFPLRNPVQGTLGGPLDAFLTGIDPAGALVHSTFLGGSNADYGAGVATGNAGQVLLTGYTASSDFLQVDPVQAGFAGGADAFVAAIDPVTPAVVFSTFLGGSAVDAGSGISGDAAGNITVGGGTTSTDFPAVGRQLSPPDGIGDAFLVRIAACAAPGPIFELHVARAGGDLTFTWTDVLDATSYELRSDPDVNGTFATLLGTAPTGLPGITIPAPPDPLLFFRVSGRNACGEGPR